MSTNGDRQYEQFLAQARIDPAVVGLVLGGSRGKGFQSARSDYDLYLIVRDEAVARYRAQFPQQRTAFGAVILHWGDDYPWMKAYRRG